MSDATPHGYDPAMLDMLQLIWGEGFLSPGGPQAVRDILAGIDLGEGHVLDIGCGLGGLDQEIARIGRGRVTGVDIAAPLVELAKRHIAKLGLADRIDLLAIEPEKPLPFSDGVFDVVFGKDSWLHVIDKRAFLKEVYRVLRPGGHLAAGDWMKGPEPFSPDMLYFIELEGIPYHPATLAEYGLLLHEIGFEGIRLIDLNHWYRDESKQELARLKGELYQPLTQRLGASVRDHFLEDWRMLTVVLEKGELRPGRIWARKPLFPRAR
jgi:phosphoethanolamine N-methyltransferase